MAFSPMHYFSPLDSVNTDVVRTNTFRIVISNAPNHENLEAMCNKIMVKFPNTAPVELAWIAGFTNFAGRMDAAIEFSGTFYTAAQDTGDSLNSLVQWRDRCLGYTTGRIGLAHEYKKTASIHWMNPSMEQEICVIHLTGLWPKSIDDVQLDVSTNDAVQVNATFRADTMIPNMTAAGFAFRKGISPSSALGKGRTSNNTEPGYGGYTF